MITLRLDHVPLDYISSHLGAWGSVSLPRWTYNNSPPIIVTIIYRYYELIVTK